MVVAVILILLAGYLGYRWIWGGPSETRYVLTSVQKTTVIFSITGNGQVSSSNQLDLKSKVSGDVIYLGAISGQEVSQSFLIVQLNADDAQKSVRDAETNLESAKISLTKLKQPADKLSLIQAENSLASALEAATSARDDLKDSYEDGFNATSNAFLDLPAVMSGLQDVLMGTTLSKGSQPNYAYYADAASKYDEKVLQYRDEALASYQTARETYDQNFQDYIW